MSEDAKIASINCECLEILQYLGSGYRDKHLLGSCPDLLIIRSGITDLAEPGESIENTFGILVARWQLFKDRRPFHKRDCSSGMEIYGQLYSRIVMTGLKQLSKGSLEFAGRIQGLFNGQGSVPWQMGIIIHY
ncbi:unnamed protein product [Allacma fusca]|uniref:Uncharacterized protein n=1 Tax=Allacma fusca TaxID=39272 RepID=A0A8J2P756_9HEXA|nr:unnamed protein product [Allacma fusca]